MGAHTLYSSEIRAVVLAHYERAVPFIVRNFPMAPIEAVQYAQGLDGPPEFTAALHRPVPPAIPTVEVGEFGHTKRYIAAAENSILWLVHRNAIGFESWTPSERDPESVGFGRVVLSGRNGATVPDLRSAMRVVRAALRARRVECIPVLGGGVSAALFIPFCDCPTYDEVRSWLHDVVNEAAASDPAHLSTDVEPPKAPLVHLCVATNAVGRISALPYTLAGSSRLEMLTPIDWSELETVRNGDFTAANSGERLARGDVFKVLAEKLRQQPFAPTRR